MTTSAMPAALATIPVEIVSRRDATHVAVDGGKYTVVIVGDGGLHALRHGQPWRDLCGDKLVFNLAWELNEARSDLAALRASHAEMLAALREAKQELWDVAHSGADPDDESNMDSTAVSYRMCRDAIACAEALS